MSQEKKNDYLASQNDPTRINPTQYIESRVQGQIDYFNKKSSHAQREYKKYKRIEFILAASIPVVITFSSMGVAKDAVLFVVTNGKNESVVNLDLIFQITAAVAGIVMTIINKLVDLEDYHKRWTDFRVNSEALEHEKHLFMTRSSGYDDEEEAFIKFVDKVESILNNDVQRWKQKSKQEDQDQGQQQPKRPRGATPQMNK